MVVAVAAAAAVAAVNARALIACPHSFSHFFKAILFHPTLNNDTLSDIAWCLSMYLESCAIIPQLFMFQRSSSNKGTVEVLISHSVFALGKRLDSCCNLPTSFTV